MKQRFFIFITLLASLFVSRVAYSQESVQTVTLDEVVNVLSLKSSAAQIEQLAFQSELLQFENYKKGYLPSLSFNLNPVSFNRSLRLLQNPTDGSYSYVDD